MTALLTAPAGERCIDGRCQPCVDRASCTGYVPTIEVENVPVDSPLALALLAVAIVGIAWKRRK